MKVGNRWVVADAAQIGMRTPTGRLVTCTAEDIQPGDFVDVCVVADIATYLDNGPSVVQVRFALQQVIRLQRAVERQVCVCSAHWLKL